MVPLVFDTIKLQCMYMQIPYLYMYHSRISNATVVQLRMVLVKTIKFKCTHKHTDIALIRLHTRFNSAQTLSNIVLIVFAITGQTLCFIM